MHWKLRGTRRKFTPNLNKFGFVYIITNKKNRKAYIGCKQYFLGRSKLKSKWEIYMGSSKSLLDDIKKTGKKHFKFEVIAEYKNKRSLRYYECYYQMINHVLTAKLEGTDDAAYYNNYIGGKFTRPVQEPLE